MSSFRTSAPRTCLRAYQRRITFCMREYVSRGVDIAGGLTVSKMVD